MRNALEAHHSSFDQRAFQFCCRVPGKEIVEIQNLATRYSPRRLCDGGRVQRRQPGAEKNFWLVAHRRHIHRGDTSSVCIRVHLPDLKHKSERCISFPPPLSNFQSDPFRYIKGIHYSVSDLYTEAFSPFNWPLCLETRGSLFLVQLLFLPFHLFSKLASRCLQTPIR